jgi:D-alanyl-D-alanine-carboxypeptidase/D-alanyl-D-alanine-endopeptidase
MQLGDGEHLPGQIGELVEKAARRRPGVLAVGVTGDRRRTVAGTGLDPAMATSLFEIGSISKALTGTLLAQMHLAGEVDLGDPLSLHLSPDLAPSWREREPRLIDLASHRADLPNTPPPLGRRELAYSLGLRGDDPWTGLDQTEYRALLRRVKTRGRVEKVRYSSIGFGLLGEALARRAGVSYEQLLRDRLCEPLGMADTWVDVPARLHGRLLGGHTASGRPRPPIADLMPAAGSVRSDIDDMLTLLEASLRPADDELGRALALAQTPITPEGRIRIGLGWMTLERKRRPRVVWHNGGTWGFRSFAGFVPETGVGVVALANSSRDVSRFGLKVLEAAASAPRSFGAGKTRP